MPKVSIVVPCYNVARYVKECLDSLTGQTLQDIEILCIDDKSTDNTLEIIRECAAADERIHVFAQPQNAGQGAARNLAIEHAKGEYLLCVDSDDMLAPDACEKLVQKADADGLDMLMFSGYNFKDTRKTRIPNPYWSFEWTGCLNGRKIFNWRDIQHCLTSLPVSACLMLCNLNFLRHNNILFHVGLRFEDNAFLLKALLNAKRISVDKNEYYIRRVHNESTTQNWDKYFADYIKIIDLMLQYLASIGATPFIYEQYRKGYVNIAIKKFKNFTKSTRKLYQDEFRRLLLKYAPSKVWVTYRFLPIRLFKKMFVRHVNYKKDTCFGIKKWYKKVTGKKLNLYNPQTFNEKIQWSKIFDSTPIKTLLADKYLVRDWVAEKIGEQYLIPLLGVYDSFEEIDFDKLPNRFVIKCNHGSAYNIIVKDKSALDLDNVKAKLDKWMAENFAFKYGYEMHYRDIPPKIIIEQYMEDGDADDLPDYKVWCFNGKTEFIWIDINRFTDHKRRVYDANWNTLDITVNAKVPISDEIMPKPDYLEELLHVSSVLSEGFPHVRVDFYVIGGKLYFGEMTFTSSSGTSDIKPKSFDYYLANKFVLPHKVYNVDTGRYYRLPQYKPTIWTRLLFPYHMWQQHRINHTLRKAIPITSAKLGRK